MTSSYHLEDRGKCNKNELKTSTHNIPKLRFKGYNDEWKGVKLKNICSDFIVPMRDKPKEFNGNIPWCRIEDIEGNYFHGTKSNQYVSQETIDVMNLKIIPTGSVICSCSASLGTYAINTRPIITNQTFIGLVCSDKISNHFLLNLMHTQTKKLRIIAGGTTIPYISREKFEEYNIKIPNKDEQEKIASFLTLIDKKIEKQKELVELLKKYKRGLLSVIFSQKLRFKDDNGNDYPAWEEKRLGDICKIVGGGTPDTNNVKYWGDDINWFTPTEIIKKYADSSNRKISRLGLLKSSAKILPIGTVLLTTRATLGEMSILKIEATTNQGFQSLIPVKDEVSSEFIYYCQPIIKHFCYKYANGSTFLEISKQTLAKLKLMIPNKDEQNKISDFLSKFDNKIQQEECILSYLKTYKKGLLQQMFI